MPSLKSGLALFKGLIQGEVAYTGPAYLILDVTRRCNIHCLGCFFHCTQERKPMPGNHRIKDLPFELVQKICRELPRLGTCEIVLVGEGEPFLHPRLTDYISAFKQAGLKVQVFTNGTLVNEEKALQLVESGLDVLIVTFWAVNPEEHKRCHPGVSTKLLQKRIEGLDLLMRAKQKRNRRFPLINLNMPINRHNCMNIEGRMELIRASRCDSVSFGFYRDWGGEFESLCLLPEDIERIREDLTSARRQLESLGVKHNVDEYLGLLQLDRHAWSQVPCYAGWFQSYLKVDGTVLPCCHCYSEVGNLMEKSFAEIWNGAAFREFRRLGSSSKTLASLGEFCDCANCCQMKDNLRVHRLFKWVAPLLPVTAGREIKAGQLQ